MSAVAEPVEGRATSFEIEDAYNAIFEALRDEDGLVTDPPCRDAPELFFPKPGDPAPFPKSICGMCRAQTACLTYAIMAGEVNGIWGGVASPGRKRPSTISRELTRIRDASEL